MISFTYLPDNKSVSSILSTLVFNTDYDQVSTWDSTTSTWKHWVNDSDFNDFTAFEYGKTYEIYNKSGVDKSFSVTGKSPGPDINHQIKVGDNFISPAVKTATNVSTVLSGLTLGTHYSDVKRFNATTQVWESYASSQFTQFEPGKGYNIIGLQNSSFNYGNTQQTTTFVYDSTGSRVKKTVGVATTIYLGKDYDITGSTSTKYIFLGDRRISMKDSSGTLLFYHTDHINSSNVVTDSSGNQAALLEYSPYGETVTHTGSANPKHKFTGQESDDSTRLYYYGARYYDPQLGRFITADWIVQAPGDPQSLNRYAYARNNPIKYIDPTGNFFWLIAIAIAAIVGAIVNVSIQAATGNIHSFKDLGKAALVGAAGGALTAAGGMALGPVLGALGVAGSIVAQTAGEMAVLAGSAYLTNGVDNSLNGRNFNQGGWQAAAFAATTYGVAKFAGPVIQKGVAKLNQAVLKPALGAIKAQLNQIPGADSIGRQLRNAYNYLDDTLGNELGSARIGSGADDLPKNAKIEKIVNDFEGLGIKGFKPNELNAALKQEYNKTFYGDNQLKINIRIETHPLKSNGLPQRHGNVDFIVNEGTQKQKIPIHITKQE